MKRLLLAFLLLSACSPAAVPVVAPAAAADAGVAEEAAPEPCPDEVPSVGLYENDVYGFSVLIPKGLGGHWNSPGCIREAEGCICMGDHGRVIPLSREPGGHDRSVEVYAGWNDPDECRTSAAVARRFIGFNPEAKVRIEKRRSFLLGGLRASRLVAHGPDAQLKPTVNDIIAVIDDGVEYTVSLWTPEGSYATDRLVFEAIAKTWKRIPVDD